MAENKDYIRCTYNYGRYGAARELSNILNFVPPSIQQARDMMYSKIETDLNIKTKEDLQNDKHETH